MHDGSDYIFIACIVTAAFVTRCRHLPGVRGQGHQHSTRGPADERGEAHQRRCPCRDGAAQAQDLHLHMVSGVAIAYGRTLVVLFFASFPCFVSTVTYLKPWRYCRMDYYRRDNNLHPHTVFLDDVDLETSFVRPQVRAINRLWFHSPGSETPVFRCLEYQVKWGAAGSVWWGSSSDDYNMTMCGSGPGSKSYYTTTKLGPAVKGAAERAESCAKKRCNSHGTCWTPPTVETPAGKLACDCDMGYTGDDCKKV